jgi:anti-sigma factor RsiW
MQNTNERPICHRAEDLVTYLYGEASDEESRDFAAHLSICDACRSEFAIFEQVHSSIVEWRTEALGAVSFAHSPQPNISAVPAVSGALSESRRSLSAVAALREFFKVSPVWLRAAAAVASVLFCILAALAVARFSQRTMPVVNQPAEPKFSRAELDAAVDKAVKDAESKRIKESNAGQLPNVAAAGDKPNRRPKEFSSSPQLARRVRLTREEREQLAADLRLIPGADEDETPFVLPGDAKFPNEPK